MRSNGIRKVAPLLLFAFAFQLTPFPGNIAQASAADLTGQYDCNSGEKVAELDDPSHPVVPYYEIYNSSETLTVRSGNACAGIVIIPSGVQEIGDNTFKNSAITEIVLPDTLRSIGTQVFQNSFLARINLPEGIVTISNSSFKNSMLTEIKIPNSVETIEADAFYNISELVTLKLGTNLKTIGAYAFSSTGITELTLPPGLETVGTNAFSSTFLLNIFIPQSVQTIGTEAFAYNPHLNTLSITDSVTFLAHNAFASSNMAFVDTSYCGTDFLDFEGNFYGSTPTCRSPSSLSVVTAISNSEKSITLTIGKFINHGGAPIVKYKLENDAGVVLQTINYSSETVFVLRDQPTGKNLRFRVKAENSAGLSGYSSFTTGITFRAIAEENEETRKQAEVKREQEVLKSREISLSKLKSGGTLSLEDFNKSDLFGVTLENYGRIQNRINKTIDKTSPRIQDIEKAVKHVGTVDAICLKAETPISIRAQDLVEIGLIPQESKHRTQIWYLVKNSPAVMRQDESSLVALIGQIQAVIADRKNRIEELKARSAARKLIP